MLTLIHPLNDMETEREIYNLHRNCLLFVSPTENASPTLPTFLHHHHSGDSFFWACRTHRWGNLMQNPEPLPSSEAVGTLLLVSLSVFLLLRSESWRHAVFSSLLIVQISGLYAFTSLPLPPPTPTLSLALKLITFWGMALHPKRGDEKMLSKTIRCFFPVFAILVSHT